MKRSAVGIAAAAFASIAAGAAAQTGDPDRAGRQEALAHAVAIQSAWSSVERRIRITDAADLWESEWTGLTAPPSGSWWLASWTERGLTARYCDGVLAVYAARDELKGVQREHREVQIAPALYGGGRTGLHVILANSRIAVGAHGRDDAALPNCMAVPSTTGDRVGLVSAVADPVRTVTGYRWKTETRDVPCANSPSDSIREARRMPIQLTSVRGAGDTRGRDLAVTDPGNLDIWPSDCGLRAGLGPQAQCTAWKRVGGGCPHVFAQAPAPAAIPDPVIAWRTGPVHRTTGSCGCPAGYTGSCTLHYEQNTEYRDFQVRPGAPVVTTRHVARVNGGRRLVSTVDTCQPRPPADPPKDPPENPLKDPPKNPRKEPPRKPEETCEDRGDCDTGGPDSDEGTGSNENSNSNNSSAEDDSANEAFGGSSMGPPGSMGNANTPGVEGSSTGSGDNGGGGGGGGKPIILDLDGDGVELVPLDESTAFYDLNGDGYRERMAWASADDGFLAYDKDGDGRIAAHDELSFVGYAPGARTDLEGLRHFDTDGDGQLDPDDAEWDAFRVWRDLDQDGESDAGELSGLDEAGIRSISLTSDGKKRKVAGNTVFGEGRYVGGDGPRAFWDVELRFGERKR